MAAETLACQDEERSPAPLGLISARGQKPAARGNHVEHIRAAPEFPKELFHSELLYNILRFTLTGVDEFSSRPVGMANGRAHPGRLAFLHFFYGEASCA